MNKEERVRELASDMDFGCTKRDLYPDDAKEIAKALDILGYRKTIWHNVADNDLPSKTGKYLIINGRGNYDVLIYCTEDRLGPYDEDYDFEKDDNMMNLKKGFNDFDSESCEYFVTDSVVAWMEIPKYE